MRVVYTYCNINNTKPSDFFIKLAKLSICSMKKFAKDNHCVLYTDCPEYFRGMPFDEIIDTDFFDWDWDKRYWNIPKMKTYSLQEEPFVHFDLDIVILQKFSFPKVDGIITELVRPLTSIDIESGCMKNIYPDIEPPALNVCSGIIGITDMKYKYVFDEMYQRAHDICKPSDEEVKFGYLFSLEESSVYQIANRDSIEVGSINPMGFMHYSGGCKEDRHSKGVDMLLKNFGFYEK